MRILMRNTAAGPNGTLQAGVVYEVATDEGRTLVECGAAVDLTPPPIETAARKSPARKRTVTKRAKKVTKS